MGRTRPKPAVASLRQIGCSTGEERVGGTGHGHGPTAGHGHGHDSDRAKRGRVWGRSRPHREKTERSEVGVLGRSRPHRRSTRDARSGFGAARGPIGDQRAKRGRGLGPLAAPSRKRSGVRTRWSEGTRGTPQRRVDGGRSPLTPLRWPWGALVIRKSSNEGLLQRTDRSASGRAVLATSPAPLAALGRLCTFGRAPDAEPMRELRQRLRRPPLLPGVRRRPVA